MQGLGKMLTQLGRYRSQWEELAKASGAIQSSFEITTTPGHLTDVTDFGSNPGNLRMLTHVPQNAHSSPPLVVVLHGCTQTAAGYDHGSGWSTLADRYGFALLFPEQQEANNPKLCFDWFQLGDIQRDRGEAYSIRQMIDKMIRDYGVDRSRIFITGLSAGGAMTSAMLATYPELFSGGAIIAGLPYRCATSVPEAFECMFQGQTRPAQEWGDLVRAASPHHGPWPRISVWHGSADATVKSMNAGEIIKQWTDVHGLASFPSRDEIVDGYPRRVWTDPAGRDVIEEYIITGMAHGTPLAVNGENGYGAAGPFLLETGISSSYRIAQFWGLTRKEASAAQEKPFAAQRQRDEEATASSRPAVRQPSGDTVSTDDAAKGKEQKQHSSLDVGSVITKALRAAGLIK